MINSLVKRAKPVITIPTIQEVIPSGHNSMGIELDLEVRNNGKGATRLYICSAIELKKDSKKVGESFSEYDDVNDMVIFKKFILESNSIVPIKFRHNFLKRVAYNECKVTIISYYYNQKNKKKELNRYYLFEKKKYVWEVKEIKD